jgi:hypothetical protein
MKNYKDTNNNLHFLDDEAFSHLLPDGCVEITDEEAEQIRLASIPQPTLADLAEAVRLALQSAIDDKAKSFGFSGGNALMLYAGFLNPFQPLAQVFATWEASVWIEADAYKQEVIAGNKPMLSGDEAVALMPVYPS